MSRYRLTLAMACALLAAQQARAGSNLLINPEFTTSLAGWSSDAQGGGSAFWYGNVGYPAPGSLILSAPSANSSASIWQCVPIAAPADLRFDFRSYTAISSVTGTFAPSLKAYGTDDCSGTASGELFTGTYSYPGGYTQWHQPSATLPLGALSVRVRVDASVSAGGGAAEIRLDHFLLAPAELVFEDAFETE